MGETNFETVNASVSLKVAGNTLSGTELGYVDGITPGTAAANKAAVLGANKEIDTLTVTNGKAGVTNGLTAFAGGGQGSAVALVNTICRITTCATNGDSVKLPAAVAGLTRTVINRGAAYANIFPQTGENIDALSANVAVSCPAGATIVFSCAVDGTWDSSPLTKLDAKYSTGSTTTTHTAGQLTGAAFVVYENSNATPGQVNTRTAAQMFADDPYARVGHSYILRIMNSGANSYTTGAGSGVNPSYDGIVIPTMTAFDFIVTYTSPTALTIQPITPQ